MMGVYCVLLVVLLFSASVRCDYRLAITFHSFSNVECRLAASERCCDTSGPCSMATCDSFFRFCVRPIGLPVSSSTSETDLMSLCNGDEVWETGVMKDTDSACFTDMVFGNPNPAILTGSLWPNNGRQLYLELLDSDRNGDDLIDRFAISISVPINTTTEPQRYRGIFNVSELELSFCVSCEPGYGGSSCELNTSNCEGVSCDSDQVCVVPAPNTCKPGYNGTTCTTPTISTPKITNTDVCEGVNCSGNGECAMTEKNFKCNCRPGYTGVSCEAPVNGYELRVTINSYSNPTNTCAACANKSTRCCDTNCLLGCDVYFVLCTRPYASPEPLDTLSHGGVCLLNTVKTRVDFNSAGSVFQDSVLGTPNPIRFQDIIFPMNGVQLYLEMIDDDPGGLNRDDLIDIFIVDMILQATSSSSTQLNLTGINNISAMSFQFEAQCLPGFTGNFCTSAGTTPMPTPEVRGLSSGAKYGIISFAVIMVVMLLLVIILVVLGCIVVKQRREKKTLRSVAAGIAEEHDYSALTAGYQLLRYRKHGRTDTGTSQTKIATDENGEAVAPDGIPLVEFDGSRNYDYATPYVAVPNQCYTDSACSRLDTPIVSKPKYESLYWHPSSEEEELIMELRKLNLKMFEESELELQDYVASGAFGMVHKGLWHRSETEPHVVEVAVKSLKKTANQVEKIQFLQEAAIMGQFDHPYIIKIFGVMVAKGKYYIIGEFMTKGSLLKYLRSLQPRDFDEMELKSELLSYSRQVANGMEYLRLRGYVHRDLAARNILLSKDSVCKIADFGLSRDLQSEDFYLSHGGKIPVKWTAPEALQYRLYSPASDAWSYDVVLYEIWSLGSKPYHELTNEQVPNQLSSGYRLPPPPGCPRVIYDIMMQCWHIDADSRLTFVDAIKLLNQPDFRVLRWSPDDMDTYSVETRTVGSPMNRGRGLFTELQQTYLEESLVPYL